MKNAFTTYKFTSFCYHVHIKFVVKVAHQGSCFNVENIIHLQTQRVLKMNHRTQLHQEFDVFRKK